MSNRFVARIVIKTTHSNDDAGFVHHHVLAVPHAVQGDGACPEEGAVGYCDMGEIKLYYYEGDPGGLEIGCGFSDGEWTTLE